MLIFTNKNIILYFIVVNTKQVVMIMLLSKKKWFLSLFASVTMFSVVAPLSAFANESSSTVTDTYQSSPVQNSEAVEQRVIEPQWKTKVAREVLEALRDKITSKQAINDVKYAIELLPNGKKWSGLYEDAVYGMKANIDELLKWESVTMTNLTDKLAGALYDVGIPLSWARRFASIVIEVLL
jgi:hypothetical protein